MAETAPDQTALERAGLPWWSYVIGFASWIPLVGLLFALVAATMGFMRFRSGGWKLVAISSMGLLITCGSALYLILGPGLHDGGYDLEELPRIAGLELKKEKILPERDLSSINSAVVHDPRYYRLEPFRDLQEGNFENIKEKMWGCLKAERHQGKDTWMNAIYGVLSLSENIGTLEDWARREPQCHFAWTALGRAYMKLAWSYRGDVYAVDVPPQNWRPFQENLVMAGQCLNLSYRLAPQDPYSSAYYISVIHGLGLDRAEMEKAFQRAVGAVPLCAVAYLNKANYLLPQWYGTWEEYEEFCRTHGYKAPIGSRVRFLIIDYLNEAGRRSGDVEYLKRPDYWPGMRNEYEAYLNMHPEGDATRSEYAFKACQAGDWAFMKRQFLLLEGRPGELWKWGGWYSQQDYENMRSWSLKK